jgi:hypothetical protein
LDDDNLFAVFSTVILARNKIKKKIGSTYADSNAFGIEVTIWHMRKGYADSLAVSAGTILGLTDVSRLCRPT